MLSPKLRNLMLATVPLMTTLAAAGVAPPSAEEMQPLIGTRWFGIYLAQSKCGYAKEVVRTVEGEGNAAYAVDYDMTLKLKALGQEQEVRTSDYRTFAEDGGLLTITSEMVTAAGSQKSEGTIVGDKMEVVSTLAGRKTTRTVDAPEMGLGEQLGANLLIARGTDPGEKVEAAFYDANLARELKTITTIGEPKEIVFNGVSTKVWSVATAIPELNVTTQSWVTAEGLCLDTEQSYGLMKMRIRLEDENSAKDIGYSHDLVNDSVVKPDKAIDDSARCRRLKLRLSNVDSEKLIIPSNRMEYTRLGEGRYEVECTVERVDAGQAPPLPVKRPEMQNYLASEEMIQSDAPKIKQKAEEITDGERNSWRAACKINLWVYRNIEKVGTATFSNALDTLRTMQGDCSEHSALATALCRASGVPARQASGLVYWPSAGGFAGHQWVEVWVGRWVAMDPAFPSANDASEPQDVADATHLKFAEGSLRDAAAVYGFFSKLKIEVLQSE